MSTQSGTLPSARRDPILTQGEEPVWRGAQPSPGLSRTPSGHAATFDGRIDNAGDLLRRLGSIPIAGRGVDDAQIALAAFDRGGLEGLRGIVGDWSLAIWDGSERVLH